MPWGPPLDVRTVQVYRALFDAQMDHTIDRVRDGLKNWCAVHVTLDASGSTRVVVPKEQLRQTLSTKLAPWAILHDPEILTISNPTPPPSTLVTYMPHKELPKRVRLHQTWTYLAPSDTHHRMNDFVAKAGTFESLFDSPKGQVIMDDWAGRVATPLLEKVLRAITAPGGSKVTLYDSEFGHEAPLATFLAQTDRILHALERKTDMLYFDDKQTWAVAYRASGPLRVVRVNESTT